MEGIIIHHSEVDSKGVIRGIDGNRYSFTNNEWKNKDIDPKVNMNVDFIVKEGNATQIYVLKSDNITSDKVKNVAKEFKSTVEKLNVIENLDGIFKNGMQEKFGFFVSLFSIIMLFTPISLYQVYGEALFEGARMTNGFLGTLIILGLMSLAATYYMGINKKITRILSIIVIVLMVIQFLIIVSSGGSRGAYGIGANMMSVLLLSLTAVFNFKSKKVED